MIMDNQLQTILEHFHGLTDLPVRWMIGEETVLRLDAEVFSVAYDKDVRDQLLNSGENICYQITPESLVYGFIRLQEPEHSGYIMVGPTILNGDRHLEVVRLGEAFHRATTEALWDYVNSLKVSRLEEFFPMMNTLFVALRRKKFADRGSLYHQFSTHIKIEDFSEVFQATSKREEQRFQEDILYCIETGQIEELRSLLKGRNGLNTGVIPDYEGVSPLRTIQDVFVTSTALCAQAAVHGGVNRDLVNEWSARFISLAERVRSFPEAQHGIGDMMLFFAEQVANIQRFSEKSELVQKAASYVAGHLKEKITVGQIAEAMNVNASYLSHEFKRQTGMSLSELIMREKVEEAKRLLRRKRASILEISQQLGFSSQQYFQNVFKKMTGTTPAQYQHDSKT